MKLNVLKLDGTTAEAFKADKAVFGIEPNDAVIRQAVLAEMTNMRQGTHSTKNRAMVNGGGRKPFKQKGRGGARAGTIRSQLWRGGGTVFGPEPHSYHHKLSKKVSRLARRSVLSSKIAEDKLIVVDEFSLSSHKTSDFNSILSALNLQDKKITILVTGRDANLDKASRNLRNVYLVDAAKVSTYDIIDCDTLVVDKVSMSVLTEILKK